MCATRETEVEEWVKKYDDEMTAKDSEFHSETELYTQGADPAHSRHVPGAPN